MYTTSSDSEIPQWLKVLILIGGSVLVGYLLARIFEYLFGDNEQSNPRIFVSHSWEYDREYKSLIKKFGMYDFEEKKKYAKTLSKELQKHIVGKRGIDL